MKVSIISYDVWGNDKDGYEVNQSFYWRTGVDFNLDWNSNRDLVKFLKQEDYLAKHVKVSNLEFDDHEQVVYINRRRDGYPLAEIRIDDLN